MSEDNKVHSEHGASSAYRWMACPGSVALSRGIPDKTSSYALEGTAAHELAEVAYMRQRDAAFFVGTMLQGIEVTDDMAEAVQVYLDHIESVVRADDDIRIEQRITLDALNPPRPMFGTADCVIYKPSERILHVIDYKHGAGVAVEAVGNPQLRYYALGALLGLGPDQPCDTVVATIVQPRASHPAAVRSEVIASGDLIDFAADLVEGVERTLAADAALVPGNHCRFCRASAVCPARRDEALALAQIEFGDDGVLPDRIDPRQMTIEQVANFLNHADQIEDWLRSLRAHVQSALEAGEAVPGWKLVPKRAMRVWAAPERLAEWAKQAGVHEQEMYDHKLRSPAQIEKIVGKKNLPQDLVSSVSSGHTLARETDKRPAVSTTAGDEFAAAAADN
jgi:hypothetical protein